MELGIRSTINYMRQQHAIQIFFSPAFAHERAERPVPKLAHSALSQDPQDDTLVVQDTGPVAPSVTVDIGCLIFDRVLIYLTADALGNPSAFDFDINLTEDLAAASKALGLRSLLEVCERKAGDFHVRVREHTFADVCTTNNSGGCFLLIDGMVLDVKRWLPEHPGGDSIIPAQSLNKEAARFFEVYHSSRESFLYLKHFYIGELREEDRAAVPCEEPPSEEFLQHLRDFTPFRLKPEDKTFKSF